MPYDDAITACAAVHTHILVILEILTGVGLIVGLLGKGWLMFFAGCGSSLTALLLFSYPIYSFPVLCVFAAIGYSTQYRHSSSSHASAEPER